MKEVEYEEQWTNDLSLLADEDAELMRLSALIQGDGLRYERILKAEEEVNEL